MKKVIALILSVVMVFSLTGCKMITGKIKEEIKDTIGDAISDATGGLSDALSGDLSGNLSDAFGGITDNLQDVLDGFGGDIGGGLSDALGGLSDELSGIIGNVAGDAAGEAVGGAADAAISAAGRHERQYWADKYETNHCPFTINAVGVDFNYYFRNGGELAFWVYTEENTGDWYINDGHIISGDNKFAISLEDIESLSSCCSYDAKLYTGETIDKEDRKERDNGIFNVINSYTPVRTNYGMKLCRDEAEEVFETYPYQAYGINTGLGDQEHFMFYLNNFDYGKKTEATKLWAFPHRLYSEYPEILTDKDLETGIQIGVFEDDPDNEAICAYAFVPNKQAGGFDDGEAVDLVVTYGDGDNVVVAVITVHVGVGGKG